MNKLYYGDCLTIMAGMAPASVDLVYLDPPFNSNRDYNAIYKDETGRPLPDQIEAFSDLWQLDGERERAIRYLPVRLREAGVDNGAAESIRLWMAALRHAQPRMLAYVSYMAERLTAMRRLLKPNGSIYLHCDPTASHYIKVTMDGLFGSGSFRKEIVWRRTSGHSDAKTLGSVHDTILFYSMSEHFTYNVQYTDYDEAYIARRYRRADADGRRWMDDNLSAKGLRGGGYEYEYKGATSLWRVPIERMRELDAEGRLHFTSRGGIRIKRYLDEMRGAPLTDVWTDIPPINSQARERLGYATQKPLALLDRIVRASTNPGETVFDPFCGCATTMEAAHRLGRRWIGIDIAIHAVKRVAKVRLADRLGLVEGRDFEIDGIPRDLEGATDLWRRDPYQFQKWAVEEVDGFVTARRTGDGGVDGRLYFDLPGERDLRSMVLEAKGGARVGVSAVRDLRGVLERDGAPMAGLILLREPGPVRRRNFAAEMAKAGDIEALGVRYPRMQMLTVAEILDGRRFATPSVARAARGAAEPNLPGVG